MKNYVIIITVAFLELLCLLGCITAHFYRQYEVIVKTCNELQEQNDLMSKEIHSVTDAVNETKEEVASTNDALEDVVNDQLELNEEIKRIHLLESSETKVDAEDEKVTSEIIEDELIAYSASDIKDSKAYAEMVFAATKEEGITCPEVIKEEPVKFAVYEEDVPAVTPPAEQHLTKSGGVFYFGDQKETYYNLDMSTIVSIAHANGISGEYWVREDGAKMLGDYVMLACNRNIHPYGTLVETSLGTGISLDTGGFAAGNPYQVDIATTW